MKVSPYNFCIENISDKPQDAVLFNANKNSLYNNCGSDDGINITTLDRGIDYVYLLHQSAQQPFNTKMFRFIMDDWKNMPRELTYSYKDFIDSNYKHEKINLVSNKVDNTGERLYQVEISKHINGQNYITIEIAPKSIMHLVIFT